MGMAAWCCWCESGTTYESSRIFREKGLLWIHETCFRELMEAGDNIKHIREIIEGKAKVDETVERFLKRVEDFDRRWNNAMKMLKELGRDSRYISECAAKAESDIPDSDGDEE